MSATTTIPADPIQAAIAAAQASAAGATAQQAGAVANLAAPAAQAVVVPGVKLTMDQLAGGLTVDNWLGVKEMCFTFGQSKTAVMSDILVDIDMSMAQPAQAVKFGNPAIYFKTYDMVTEVRGGAWSEALRKAQLADPNVRPYRTVDIPMTLATDVTVPGGKGKEDVVLAEAGTTVGHSLATTNWGEWEAFYNNMKKLGLQASTVRVMLGYKKRTNTKGNTWGLVTFTYVPDAPAAN
jgi:hypothetical protein